MIVCRRCGAVFRPGVDHFETPAPAPGCRPARLWLHRDARGRRGLCVYGDGGPLPPPPPARPVALRAADERAA